MQSYILPALLWLIAFLVALFAWPVRDLSPRTRGFILVPLCAVIFAIPFFAPAAPVATKIAVALTCPLFAGKLLDAHLGASAWRGRPFLEWPVYLLNPFVLVHRRHLLERPRPRGSSRGGFSRSGRAWGSCSGRLGPISGSTPSGSITSLSSWRHTSSPSTGCSSRSPAGCDCCAARSSITAATRSWR